MTTTMGERMGKADLHIHTTCSDGAPTVHALLDHVARRTRLDVIAITDHDTIDGALEAREIMKSGAYPFKLIVGEEMSTRDGHLVGLFLHKKIEKGLSAAETIALIREQGGVAFAPHPFFRTYQGANRPITMMGLGPMIADLDLDAVETINATPFLANANRRATIFNAMGRQLPILGNSDGHILAAIGKGFTSFPGSTASDLREAILTGQTKAGSREYRRRELLTYLRFWLRQQAGLPPVVEETIMASPVPAGVLR